MRKRRRFTQVTAAFLATLMVLTNVDIAAFAVTEGSGTSTGSTTASYINSVTALQEDIAVQELEVGSSEADIVMPSVLDASVTQYTTINIQTPTQTPTQGATQPATTSTTQTTTSGQNTTQSTTSSEQNTTQSTTSSEQNTTQTTTSDQNTNQSTTQTSTSNQTTTSDQNSTQPSTGASGTESTSAQSESQAFNISQHNDREETSSSGSIGTTGTTNNTATTGETTSAGGSSASGNNGNSASNAKTVASTKQMELPVTWKIDTEKSIASEFSSVKAGEVYVYTPVFSEDIFVLDDIVIPSITVTIVNKKEVEFSQSSTIDGVTITVTADKGVFPQGVTLSVKKITDDATVKQLTEAAETAEVEAAASAAQALSADEPEQNSGTENREII